MPALPGIQLATPRGLNALKPAFPWGATGSSTLGKPKEGPLATYISTFGSRKSHDTGLPSGPLRTWRSRAAIFTRGPLKERTSFLAFSPHHRCTVYLVSTVACVCQAPGLWEWPGSEQEPTSPGPVSLEHFAPECARETVLLQGKGQMATSPRGDVFRAHRAGPDPCT